VHRLGDAPRCRESARPGFATNSGAVLLFRPRLLLASARFKHVVTHQPEMACAAQSEQRVMWITGHLRTLTTHVCSPQTKKPIYPLNTIRLGRARCRLFKRSVLDPGGLEI
jgi:hypothetical protein